MALKDDIFSQIRRQTERVEVPEWQTEVWVREMTAAERDAYEQAQIGPDGKPNMDNARAKLLVRCLADQAGELIFSAADAEKLGEAQGTVLTRLFLVASRLNGLSESEIKDAAKN